MPSLQKGVPKDMQNAEQVLFQEVLCPNQGESTQKTVR
jgi:hypothetical protein